MTGFTASPAYQRHIQNFDIDNYLNWAIPRNRLDVLPRTISFWLGYRSPSAKAQATHPAPVYWLSALIGGFIGIAIITNVYKALPLLSGQQVPIVIASFGAAAILEYNTIESPLAQPRNLVIGHTISAIIGVGITEGFERLSPARFDELRWLAGSLAVGVASAVMSITKTVHPPAGATALLASTSADVTLLGWWLIPLVLLASSLMAASALIINNITRRWPMYWWTPSDLSKQPKNDVEHTAEKAKGSLGSLSGSDSDSTVTFEQAQQADLSPQSTPRQSATRKDFQITITSDQIVLPEWWTPTDWETEVLQILQQQLQEQARR